MQSDFLDIHSLSESRDRKMQSRLVLFNDILRRCHNKIKSSAEMMETKCFFAIPQYVFGLPLYNAEMCKVFLVNKLREEKFHVVYYHPNVLFICWEVAASMRRSSLPVIGPSSGASTKAIFNSYKTTKGDEDVTDTFLRREPELMTLVPRNGGTKTVSFEDTKKSSRDKSLKYIKTGKLFGNEP